MLSRLLLSLSGGRDGIKENKMKKYVFLLVLFLSLLYSPCFGSVIVPFYDPYAIHYDTFAGDVYTLDTASITLTAGTFTADTLTDGTLTIAGGNLSTPGIINGGRVRSLTAFYAFDGETAAYLLIRAKNGAYSENSTLEIDLGSANRTLTLSGNPTLSDWFDQSVKTDDDVVHNDLTLSTPSNIYALSHDSFADFLDVEHIDWTSCANDFNTSGTLGAGITTLASGSTIGTLTLADGSITDSGGTIDFVNENLSTTGTLGAGTITGTSFIIGSNTLDTNEWAVLDGVDANMVLDWTDASAGTIDATNIEDKFLRNDGNDTTTGILTADGFTTTGIVQGNFYIINNLYHLGDLDTGVFFSSDSFFFQCGGLNFLQMLEIGGNRSKFNINVNNADIDFIVKDTSGNLLYVNAGTGRVGIGPDSSPDYFFDVQGLVQADGGFSDNGSAGLDATLTFGGGGSGDCNSITVSGGIITGYTTIP